MAHYKPERRATNRKNEMGYEWYRVASQLGQLVNSWSGRSDLVVYCGENAAEGEAVAALYHDSAEIEVNVTKAFGFTTPNEVGNLLDKNTHYDNPKAIGVIYHESLHARHSNWNREILTKELEASEARAFMLLEEVRIEARGVLEVPKNRLFLRESALNFALEEVNEATLQNISEIWQSGMLAVLAMGRFDVGILELSDVRGIHARLIQNLGQELFDSLRKIWIEFAGLKVTQVERGMELAREWVKLMKQADPEGEKQFGEAKVSEAGEGEQSGSLAELLSEIADQVGFDNAESLADQKTLEEWEKEAKERNQTAKDRNQKKQTAQKIFDKQNDAKGSGSNSELKESRTPSPTERAAAVTIAKMLEKAKYRERSLHEVRSTIPQGRLNARAAVQNAALAARGSMERVPSWDRKVRKHTDDPTLRLGVMVDISGSMYSAMEAMATTAWVMGEAGRRIQAKTAMVYYGSGVFPTLRVGQRLDQVRVFTAADGTEEFGDAYSALDGELGLTFGDGVRMLVIVSDGQYRPSQTEAARKALVECKQNGVAVLWVTPKGLWSHTARSIINEAAWGVHLDGLEVSEIAIQVGKAAAEALGKVSLAA
jgi:hypothetical protein